MFFPSARRSAVVTSPASPTSPPRSTASAPPGTSNVSRSPGPSPL